MNPAATITNRISNIGINCGGDDSSSSISNNVKYTKIPGMRHPCQIVNRHLDCHQLR
jgi:hypothetical protein